jgi:hypothetical protein
MTWRSFLNCRFLNCRWAPPLSFPHAKIGIRTMHSDLGTRFQPGTIGFTRRRTVVRLFTRNGHDWSGRFPPITETALRSRNSSFVLDGEAVPLGVNDISDFNGLHSRVRTCGRR